MNSMNIRGAQDREQAHLFDEIDRPLVYASFLRRFAALFIDWIILAIGNQILLSIMGYSILERERDPLADVITTITSWLYFALQESGGSRATLGKRSLGIQVCTLNRNRISFGQATGRHFGRYISAIILLMGYFMMLWDSRSQTLHDKVANTLVIKDPLPYLG